MFQATKVVLIWHKYLSVVGWVLIPIGFVIAIVLDVFMLLLELLVFIVRILVTSFLILLGWLITTLQKEPYVTYRETIPDAWWATNGLRFKR